FLFFFFSSRRRHTRSKRDWSSDVCSSDLIATRLDEYSHIAVFSATIPKSLHPFLNKYLENPEYVEIENVQKNKKNIEFYLIPTKGEAKIEKTIKLIDILSPYLCIIVGKRRDNANELAE